MRLAFSALPGDTVDQRVFDVRLNDTTVLEDFDIVKETGRADHAVWKEFSLELDGDLTLDLVAKAAEPTAAQLPIINGLILLRE